MSEKLTEKDIRHVAMLSRLKLTDERVHHFYEQLNDVINYVEKLSELDTEGVEPMPHPTPMHNKLREDVPTESLSNEQVLKNTAASDGAYFKVPKVLGDSSSA